MSAGGEGIPRRLGAAAQGAAVGVVLAAVTTLGLALVPRWLGSGEPFHGWHLAWHGLKMGVFGMAGAAIGLALRPALLRAARVPALARGLHAGSLGRLAQAIALGGWIAHLLALPRRGPAVAALCIACAWLAGLQGLAALEPAARRAFAPLRSPWIVFGAAAAGGWMGTVRLVEAPAAEAVLWTLAPVIALTALSPFLPRFRVSEGRIWTSFAPAALVLAGAALSLERTPRLPPPPRELPPARGPNVVLIVLDTVRADHLSLHGYPRPTTPGLERIAARATVYEQAYAPGDMTLSSHGSLFTGLWPRTHGAHFDDTGSPLPLEARHRTMAEILAAAGWRTAGMVANHVFFGPRFGLDQGFECLRVVEPAAQRRALVHGDVPPFLPGYRLYHLARDLLESETQRDYATAGEIADLAGDVLDELAAGGAPFFLFVNFMDAHWPYMPPALDPPPWEPVARPMTRDEHYALVREVVRERTRELTAREREVLEAMYDEALAYLDVHVERLVARLDAAGIADQTLLVITSDHGEALGEHGLVGHALSVHQHQVRVPLLVRRPGQRDGARASHPVSLVDILPTVCAAAGVPVPPGLHGVALDAPHEPGRPVVAESFPNPDYLGERFEGIERALVRESLKLVRTRAGEERLFDLGRDPGELEDLAADHARAGPLAEALRAWLETTPPAEARRAEADGTLLERLRQFGYAR